MKRQMILAAQAQAGPLAVIGCLRAVCSPVDVAMCVHGLLEIPWLFIFDDRSYIMNK